MIYYFTPKTPYKFNCKYCDFKCSKLSEFNRHLATQKHKILINTYYGATEKSHQCKCGKKYKHAQSLYNHKKKCTVHNCIQSDLEFEKVENYNNKDLIVMLINENKEMRKLLNEQQCQMFELIPKIGNNNTINNENNFNINVFLNEKCKDAISMNKFIDLIDISLKNLLTTKDKGLVEGISNIIIENMNKLSLYKRPIHCTDKKRETVYIKNEKWEKDEKKEQISELLKNIEKKQMQNIKQWVDNHPNYMNNELLQQEYIKLVKGCTSSIEDCKDKVIKNVCDNVYLNEK